MVTITVSKHVCGPPVMPLTHSLQWLAFYKNTSFGKHMLTFFDKIQYEICPLRGLTSTKKLSMRSWEQGLNVGVPYFSCGISHCHY